PRRPGVGRARPGVSMSTVDLARLGRWTEPRPFTPDPAHTRAYAAATNDANPWHAEGRLAPPVYGVALAVLVWPDELAAVLGADLYTIGSVHGEHDLQIARPIQPGAPIRVRARAVGVHVKASGTACVAEVETSDARGLLNRQYAVK